MIFVIDDDEIMAECIATATNSETKIFSNAIDAINSIDETPPSLIFLDILLDGPDGFTFLNELASYPDLSKIPIVIISSLNLKNYNLNNYNIVKILDKSTMLPEDIERLADEYA